MSFEIIEEDWVILSVYLFYIISIWCKDCYLYFVDEKIEIRRVWVMCVGFIVSEGMDVN